MKKLTIALFAVLIGCSFPLMAQKATPVTSLNHISIDVGLITDFSLKMAASGSINQPAGYSLPAICISSNYQKPNKRWTQSYSIAFQLGTTGKYVNSTGTIKESYSSTGITFALGNSINWQNKPDKQIYSGYKVGYRYSSITTPNNYPVYYPNFNGFTGQLDVIGFRGLVGAKKKLGYNVALGAGCNGIIRIGLIESI